MAAAATLSGMTRLPCCREIAGQALPLSRVYKHVHTAGRGVRGEGRDHGPEEPLGGPSYASCGGDSPSPNPSLKGGELGFPPFLVSCAWVPSIRHRDEAKSVVSLVALDAVPVLERMAPRGLTWLLGLPRAIADRTAVSLFHCQDTLGWSREIASLRSQ